MKNFISVFILCLFSLAGNFLSAQIPVSPWETVAPPGSMIYTDIKTAVKENANCYRVEITGSEIFLDKKTTGRIPQLTNVMALRLTNNNFSEIPAAFLRLNSLVYLRSSGNPLITLSDSIGMLDQLRFLEIYDAAFDTVPEGIYGLSRLQSLVINANKDTVCFTSSVSAFKNSLSELRISNSIIDTLPEAFSSLAKLNRLVFYKCKMNEIPAAVLQMNKLSELWLDSNNISLIPRDIPSMTGLTYLSLRGNKIKHVPSTICFLQNLNVLDLRGNPIDPYEVQCVQALLPKCRVMF